MLVALILVLVNTGIAEGSFRRRVELMESAFPEAMVERIERFLPAVPAEVDPEDRHVVAAALAGKADAIVTNNLGDFAAAALGELGLDVQTLDGFLLNQWTLDSEAVTQVLAEMEEDRNRPPKTIAELLDALEQHAPEFAATVRRELE
jgi:aspartokinase